MQSIQSIATVIQALLNKYEESTAFQPASTKPSDATREQRKPKLVHPSQDPSQAARAPRRPNTHCLRFGTPDPRLLRPSRHRCQRLARYEPRTQRLRTRSSVCRAWVFTGTHFGPSRNSLAEELAECYRASAPKKLTADCPALWRASHGHPPWSFSVSSSTLTGGVSASAQLKSTSRFSATIRLDNLLSRRVSALVGTGAERTCFSSRLFQSVLSVHPFLELFQQRARLSGANGSSLVVKGAARFPLPLTCRISVSHDIVVCDIILGMDILISTRAVINIHEQSVMFRSPDSSIAPECAFFEASPIPETSRFRYCFS